MGSSLGNLYASLRPNRNKIQGAVMNKEAWDEAWAEARAAESAAAAELRFLKSENQILWKVSDEYNAWIKHHAAGHSYDDFLSERIAHNIKENT